MRVRYDLHAWLRLGNHPLCWVVILATIGCATSPTAVEPPPPVDQKGIMLDLSGTVYGCTAGGGSGATVSLYRESCDFWSCEERDTGVSVRTDGEGRFALRHEVRGCSEGLHASSYSLHVSKHPVYRTGVAVRCTDKPQIFNVGICIP